MLIISVDVTFPVSTYLLYFSHEELDPSKQIIFTDTAKVSMAAMNLRRDGSKVVCFQFVKYLLKQRARSQRSPELTATVDSSVHFVSIACAQWKVIADSALHTRISFS